MYFFYETGLNVTKYWISADRRPWDHLRVGWACLGRCGGQLTEGGTTGPLLARATDKSVTVHGVKTSGISSSMSYANAFRMRSRNFSHIPRNLAHAHLSHFQQGLSPCLWTVRVAVKYSDTSANEDNSFRNHIR